MESFDSTFETVATGGAVWHASPINRAHAQPFEDDPNVVRAFDLMYGEKEITSGAQRVHDVDLLSRNIAAQGLDPEAFGFYLKAFEYGMPPHSGWGLGVERLLMILTGCENVRECTIFPRDKKRLVP